jgi:hypothetical protein
MTRSPSKGPKVRQPIARVPDAEIPVKTDGLGNALVAHADYYVQDSRKLCGNCIVWWRPKGADYCCDLNDAGVYKGSDVLGMRGTDVPWPVDYVRARTVTHVRGDVQAFHGYAYKPGPRS